MNLDSRLIKICLALQVCVYLMNDVVLHMQLEDGNNTTVSDLVRCVIELDELALPDYSKNIFTLWMSSGLLGELRNLRKSIPVRIVKNFSPNRALF